MIYKRLFLLSALAAGFALSASAQKKMYVLKDKKVVGVYPVSEIDSVTFALSGDVAGNTHAITAESDRFCSFSCPAEAAPGQTVIVYVKMENAKYKVSSLTANGKACTYITDDGTTFRYKFTMPDADVTLEAETVVDRHTITPIVARHAYLTMLNCCDDWTVDEDKRVYNETMDGLVKFYYGAEDGYLPYIKALSESGEKLSVEYTDKDTDFGKCYFVQMPDEPISIEVTATELGYYRGMDFVGTYQGYEVKTGDNRIFSATAPTLSAELKANTAYTAETTDDNALSAHGTYTYTEASQRISYNAPATDQGVSQKKGYGINGKYIDGGDLFVNFSNLDDDRPDNVKLYFASQYAFSYTCASTDDYGSHYLVQLKRENGTSAYYYIDTQSREVTTLRMFYQKGGALGEASQAYAYDDTAGDVLFSYSYEGDGAKPAFVFVGKERGEYTLEGGTADSNTLSLDGFGTATYGGESGTYTIQDNIVKVIAGGKTYNFVLNLDARTYSPVKSATWDGPVKFMGMTNSARFDDATSTMGTVVFVLNSNYAGEEIEGKVKVDVNIVDQYYSTRNTNACTASYTYNSTDNTLLISGVLVGTADGRSTEKIDIELSVSADKKTLTCEKDVYLRAASGGNTRYVPLKGIALTARD